MKKYLGILLIALFMCTVLFVSISCKQESAQPQETTYTVTFDTQGGSVIAPVTVKPNKTVTKPKTDPTKTGDVFFGWYTEAECTTEYKFTTKVTKSFTLYAKWISESTLGKVTFNYYDGKKATVVWVEKGKTVAQPSNPTRSYFTFDGWCTDAKGTTPYVFTTPVNGNVELYAKWLDDTDLQRCDPILPKGTGAKIPMTWSSNAKGLTTVPAVKYNFSGAKTDETNVSADLKAAIAYAQENNIFDATPKKVIFIISDGWGVTSVDMSREYKGELLLDSLPYYTQSKTKSYSEYTIGGTNNDYSYKKNTDSCAGGTQLLAGFKTRYGFIALDIEGKKVENLAEAAKRKGWNVACVTNDNIVDATPADTIIHDTNRYHEEPLHYKALMANDWDLLMGWDWGMNTFFTEKRESPDPTATWEDRLLEAEIEGIGHAVNRESVASFSGSTKADCIKYFKNLSISDKRKAAGFSVYYTIWELQDEAARHNACLNWKTNDDAKAYTDWLEDTTNGLNKAISELETKYGKPESHINRFLTFPALLANDDFSKPVLASWTHDGNDYGSSNPNRGYLLSGSIGANYPSWPEMVAYTIYQMDSMAGSDGSFFAMIENTCTDGWGHEQKVYEQMNEVQCLDEGVAIAVKYVLEHPDTLLVISADHETGGFTLNGANGNADAWKTNIGLIKSTTGSHSDQVVPLYAFGAGADRFSAASINEAYGGNAKAGVTDEGNVHEGWITGALIGQLITGEAFGQPANYVGN